MGGDACRSTGILDFLRISASSSLNPALVLIRDSLNPNEYLSMFSSISTRVGD